MILDILAECKSIMRVRYETAWPTPLHEHIQCILFQIDATQMSTARPRPRKSSLPGPQNTLHIPQFLLNQFHMPLTPRRELDLERLRSTNHLVFIRVQIDRDLLPRLLVDCMLESEGPENPRNLAPLRTLGELDSSAYAAPGTVVVMIAVLKVLGASVVPSEVRVVDIAVWVVVLWIIVFGVVKGPVRDHDGCVFGLKLRVSYCRVQIWATLGYDLR